MAARDGAEKLIEGDRRTSEAHGIDAGVMRAAEGMARRIIGLGHGADGFSRIAEVLGRR